LAFKKKTYLLNPEKEEREIEVHQNKRKIKTYKISIQSNERFVREQLSKRISGIYTGLYLLIPEHLRLGSWDLLKGWTGKNDRDIEPRLALQMVNEASLCVNGIRHRRSLCHQGFEILNGLFCLPTDKSIHELLDSHTISEAKAIQIGLGKLREIIGDYKGKLFAIDPHRVNTSSKRIMPVKKSKPKSRSKKILQTFFCINAITGQPVAFTIGSSGKTISGAALELVDMMKDIVPQGGLFMADTEHAAVDILKKFEETENYEILMPMANTKKLIKYMKELKYERQWAGYSFSTGTYPFGRNDMLINLISQRIGEIKSKYEYKGFAATSLHSSDKQLKMLTEDYPKRWTIEEFFNFEAAMGWDRASTMNLNIRYGKMSLALIAQAATYQFRKKLPKPYKNWTAKHLADTIFHGIDGDLKIKKDTIIVTLYNIPEKLKLKKHYENLPDKLVKEGINPRIPWLYNFKIDFRFK
jgi:hypothetical protein